MKSAVISVVDPLSSRDLYVLGKDTQDAASGSAFPVCLNRQTFKKTEKYYRLDSGRNREFQNITADKDNCQNKNTFLSHVVSGKQTFVHVVVALECDVRVLYSDGRPSGGCVLLQWISAAGISRGGLP